MAKIRGLPGRGAVVGPGKTIAVVGDGAVGLLGVLAAKQLGTERIITMSRHEPRQKLARQFGATDIVTERGDEGVTRIKDLTNGLGAPATVDPPTQAPSTGQIHPRHTDAGRQRVRPR